MVLEHSVPVVLKPFLLPVLSSSKGWGAPFQLLALSDTTSSYATERLWQKGGNLKFS